MKFLHCPSDYTTKVGYFDYLPKKDVKKYIVETHCGFNDQQSQLSVTSSSSSIKVSQTDDFDKSLTMALDNMTKTQSKNMNGTISSQIAVFEKSGVLSEELLNMRRGYTTFISRS